MYRAFLLFAAALLASASFTANAAEEKDVLQTPFGSRFFLSAGAYFPRLDTTVRVGDAAGNIGTQINFESNFGMNDNETLPLLSASWQIARKHRLELRSFELRREGAQTSDVTIFFNGKEFTSENVPIQAFFDTEVYALNYSYALVADPVKEFSLNFGLSIQDISTGLRGTLADGDNNVVDEKVGVTAPLPSLGIGGSWAFTDSRKWILNYRVGVFAIGLDLDAEANEEIEGRLIDGGVRVFHKTFKYVGFGAGLDYFRVKVDYKKRDLDSNFDYSYFGPSIFIASYF